MLPSPWLMCVPNYSLSKIPRLPTRSAGIRAIESGAGQLWRLYLRGTFQP